MSLLQRIKEQAEQHKIVYPTFNEKEFLEWLSEKCKKDKWEKEHVNFSVIQLNKLKRVEHDLKAILGVVNDQIKAVLTRIESI